MISRRALLRYLSHLTGAPVVATPVFVSLSLLEGAQAVYTLVAVVFASMVPIVGILCFARSEGLDDGVSERSARVRPFVFTRGL